MPFGGIESHKSHSHINHRYIQFHDDAKHNLKFYPAIYYKRTTNGEPTHPHAHKLPTFFVVEIINITKKA